MTQDRGRTLSGGERSRLYSGLNFDNSNYLLTNYLAVLASKWATDVEASASINSGACRRVRWPDPRHSSLGTARLVMRAIPTLAVRYAVKM